MPRVIATLEPLLMAMSAGPAELGGRVGTATSAGYAAPGTHLNDPEKWEGGLVLIGD